MAYGLIQRMRSWWQHDRIRASPNEGRLLRIEPGDLVSFRGQDFLIAERAVDVRADHSLVRLSCEGDAAVIELKISLQGELVGIWWMDAAGRRRCEPWEVEVWPRRRMV